MNAISLDLQLHLERSRCINAFVEVEKAVVMLSEKLCPGHNCELLSQKIRRIRDVPASSIYSKEQRKQLHTALDEVETLQPIRNDIVHGALAVLTDGELPHAAFINVRQVDKLAPVARLLTLNQLQDVTKMVCILARRLENALVRPVRQQA